MDILRREVYLFPRLFHDEGGEMFRADGLRGGA
jgi:hypothetical protein